MLFSGKCEHQHFWYENFHRTRSFTNFSSRYVHQFLRFSRTLVRNTQVEKVLLVCFHRFCRASCWTVTPTVITKLFFSSRTAHCILLFSATATSVIIINNHRLWITMLQLFVTVNTEDNLSYSFHCLSFHVILVQIHPYFSENSSNSRKMWLRWTVTVMLHFSILTGTTSTTPSPWVQDRIKNKLSIST